MGDGMLVTPFRVDDGGYISIEQISKPGLGIEIDEVPPSPLSASHCGSVWPELQSWLVRGRLRWRRCCSTASSLGSRAKVPRARRCTRWKTAPLPSGEGLCGWRTRRTPNLHELRLQP